VELDKRSLDAQTAILEEYSMRIPKLKAELAAKDARIAELEAEIVEALGEDRASAVRKDYIETVKILAKHGYHSDPSLWQRVTHVLNRIAALEAENKRLRDALKKIAQCNPQDRLCEYIVQIARAALPVKSQPLDSCENMQDSPSPGAEPRA